MRSCVFYGVASVALVPVLVMTGCDAGQVSDGSGTAAVLETEPALGLGSPTIAWIDSAFRVMGRFRPPSYPARIRQPILIVAAGRDYLISTAALESFAIHLRAGSHVVIPGALHEIMMEQDQYRAQFWAAFDAFVPGTPMYGALAAV